MSWRIHTGPFPFMVQGLDSELWLWRITDGDHYTAVVVRLAQSVVDKGPDAADGELRAALETRGRSALSHCLSWQEPPREITFQNGSGSPTYWGGKP